MRPYDHKRPGHGPVSAIRATVLLMAVGVTPAAGQALDSEAALERSQAVIGEPLGSHRLTRRNGQSIDLREYRGRPLVVSMIYTSCYHTCPTITQNLKQAVTSAREALGDDSFRVVTVGFDWHHDTPTAMRVFADQQRVEIDGWDFLSGTERSIQALSDALGFTFQASPRGFDHLTQATIIDADGIVYRQVYGETFELPWLVEPLKELVFGGSPDQHLLAEIVGRVKLFCTVYDPTTGRYEFDYSLFIQMAIGALIILSGVFYLIVQFRARRAS